MKPRTLKIFAETLPLKESFTIARGSKQAADVVVVEIHCDGVVGQAEAVPYARYGETTETVTAAIEQIKPAVEAGMSREALQLALLPGAARNVLDCALWDLEARSAGNPLWHTAGLPEPEPLQTAFTISLDSPAIMANKAKQASAYPLLKLKLGGQDGLAADLGRLASVRQARPEAAIMVDVNEGWRPVDLLAHAEQLHSFKLTLIEQPVPEKEDAVLARIDLPFCADESVHDCKDIPKLAGKYDWLNIKLDKTGGLTEALKLVETARQANFKLMVGCMVSSSLALAPAYHLAQICDLADLDGPLFLVQDRHPALRYKGAQVSHPPAA
ncbi:MAG: N-acetyl-D-Glu racemase DgcA [Parvibaculales bacterium]